MQAFLNAYPSWEAERRECIKKINELADDIDFHHRNINIAQLPISLAGMHSGRSPFDHRTGTDSCHFWDISYPHYFRSSY